jgi:hypothetical protein
LKSAAQFVHQRGDGNSGERKLKVQNRLSRMHGDGVSPIRALNRCSAHARLDSGG